MCRNGIMTVIAVKIIIIFVYSLIYGVMEG